MEEKEGFIIIPKELWQQLLDAYDRQNNKFVSVFKTIIICATILAITWFGLYYLCNRPYVNNGIMQNGNTNSIREATIEN